MHEFSFPRSGTALPKPHDQVHATALIEDFLSRAGEAGESQFADAFSKDEGGAAVLAAIFGNSPYLSQLLLREIEFVARLARDGPDIALAEVLKTIGGAASAAQTESPSQSEANAALMKALRIQKGRGALLIAVADITEIWDVPAVTAALSQLAAATLTSAVQFLVAEAESRGDLIPGTTDATSGYLVLAMGKLGAGELNYSSDVDLIVLYDQEAEVCQGKRGAQAIYARLTQDLVRIIQDRTPDGYVFRTDLRLRPDSGATPIALSMAAAETYYESVGQNWERAALIKATPIAGDINAGNDYLTRIKPFIWRKNLDFAAIADIHSIKRQMDRHGNHRKIGIFGHNIKLGQGGIREIEFFVQTQQLIAGGREPLLRHRKTIHALAALADLGRIAPDVQDDLTSAYHFLRRLEHRIQMVADEQTHTLPTQPDAIAHIATFAGFNSVDDFERTVLGHLNTVQGHFGNLFNTEPKLGGTGPLVFTGTDDDPETLTTIRDMGYAEPEKVAAAIRRWHHGRYRATRSARAREILTALIPGLLAAIANTTQPDTAFARFDEFLEKLPAGVQLFSLFQSNMGLLSLVAEIVGAAPRLAEYLAHTPEVLDAALLQVDQTPVSRSEDRSLDLQTTLAVATDYEDILDRTRRWKKEEVFLTGVRVLRHAITAEQSEAALSDVAETTIRELLPRVRAEFEIQHGTIPGAEFILIGMGKLGSLEMMFGSDLDLIFLYDSPDLSLQSNGQKPLSVSQYFSRLSQRMINALSAMTAEGRIYEIDMRLRPSGTAGPIAVHIHGIEKYQREDAWIWERMALTRARVIDGDPALTKKATALIRTLLRRPTSRSELVAGVAEMRGRIEQERPAKSPWDVKYARGGLVDIEFLCQYFQLLWGQEDDSLLVPNTLAAFVRFGEAGRLDPEIAKTLIEQTSFFHALYMMLRLCLADEWSDETIPDGLAPALARATGDKDLKALRRRLVSTEQKIYAIFEKMIEIPAAQHAETESTRD